MSSEQWSLLNFIKVNNLFRLYFVAFLLSYIIPEMIKAAPPKSLKQFDMNKEEIPNFEMI